MALSRMIAPALLGLAIVALAAQASPPPGELVAVTPATAAAPAAAPPAALPAPPAPAPPAGCGPCTQTICVREPAKVPHVHVAYRCKTRTICLPYCTGKFCHKPGCCEGCDAGCGDCGKPRQVRVLIKRFVKEERCETPCVPKEVPAAPVCPAPCAEMACPTPCGPGTAAVIHGATKLPPPERK
jgi:hypothetical protein